MNFSRDIFYKRNNFVQREPFYFKLAFFYAKYKNENDVMSFNIPGFIIRFGGSIAKWEAEDEIEKAVLENEKTQEQLQGRTPKKVIIVPGKIINIVG